MAMLEEGDFPPKLIIDWQKVDDYPSGDELEKLCWKSYGSSVSCDDWYFLENLHDAGMLYPIRGDKLAGWPDWVQFCEYPSCPSCNRKMEQLIYQPSSSNNIPLLWGDAGSGYIFQCSEHKDRVAFLWQCC